ncbi:MAG: hypothetical protein JJ975_04715 [Bacteroidia bacterium]|nr:hypothetical protein [Bacteroidia bacterium]
MGLTHKLHQITTANSTRVLIDQALYSGTNFLSMILLARLLNPYEFGWFSTILIAVYLLMNVSNALIIQPMQVRLASCEDQTSYLQFLLVLTLITLFTIGLISLAALGILDAIDLKHVSPLFEQIHPCKLVVFALTWLAHDFFRKLFLANQKLDKAIAIDSLLAAFQITGLLWIFFVHMERIDVVLKIMTASLGLSAAMGYYLSRITPSFRGAWKTHLQYHLKQGSFLFMSSMLQWWSSQLFVITSGVILGIASLGAFRLVQSAFGALGLFLQAIENYVLPKAALLLNTSWNQSKTYVREIGLKGGLPFTLLLLLLFIFSKPTILALGGEEYLSFHYVVRWMAILYLIIFASYTIRIPLRILGLNKSYFKGYAITFIFSLLSYRLLLENFGITGAIWGLIINQLLLAAYWKFILNKNNFKLWT